MSVPKSVSSYMRNIGKRGGSVKTDAKADAARENGKRGGRPRKKPGLTIGSKPSGR